jgi:hypothetical protein
VELNILGTGKCFVIRKKMALIGSLREVDTWHKRFEVCGLSLLVLFSNFNGISSFMFLSIGTPVRACF